VKRIFLLLIFLLPASFVSAFPENSETRTLLREIITAPTGDVLKQRSMKVDQLTDGVRVEFRVEEQNDSFYLLFLNEIDGEFPVYGQGSYIIKRNLENGKFVQIKIFLKNHTGCYARIYPNNDRTILEIYLYGKKIYTDINLPYDFADVLTEPFSAVMDASAGTVDWNLIFPANDYGLYSDKIDLAADIRQKLPELGDADDGAMDSDGKYIFIESLKPQPQGTEGFNCSGFVKWVGDAFYWRNHGEYLSVSELKQKHIDLRGNRWSSRHEDDRDPYFGLDWTRNIAVSIEKTSGNPEPEYRSADVNYIPWSRYTEDIGFPIEDLKLVMYYLAVTEPMNIYLASVNVPFGTGPILQQHIHTTVLVPVINADGTFKDLVFERNFESTADLLAERYPDAHIHLVRIRTGVGFKLPEVSRKPSMGLENLFRR